MSNIKLTYKDAAKYATGVFVVVFLTLGLLMSFGSSAFFPSEERPNFERNFSIWHPIIGAVFTYLYLFFLFSINFKIFQSKLTERKKIFFIFIAAIAVALFFNTMMTFSIQAFGNTAILSHEARIGSMIKDLGFAVFVFIFSFIIYLSFQKQQMVLKYEVLKAENARSRFEALKNQLDPHFLFNTFNTLDSLIDEEPEKARNYLQQLSSIFRYVIPNKELTTLEEELNFSRSYTKLMQIRYENNLVVEFDIDKQYLVYEIVPLSIQLLIENAIKHNVISSEKDFVIRITVGPEPQVTVSNRIIPKKTPYVSDRVGLINLTERFRLTLQKEIEITDKNGIFAVTLPLQTPKKAIV